MSHSKREVQLVLNPDSPGPHHLPAPVASGRGARVLAQAPCKSVLTVLCAASVRISTSRMEELSFISLQTPLRRTEYRVSRCLLSLGPAWVSRGSRTRTGLIGLPSGGRSYGPSRDVFCGLLRGAGP